MAEVPVFTGSLDLFLKFAKNGELYEYIRDKLGLQGDDTGRKQANLNNWARQYIYDNRLFLGKT